MYNFSPLCLQMSQLTRLHTLSLRYVNSDSDSYAPLRALRSSLRRLALATCYYLPACLPEMTGLEALLVDDCEAEEAATAGDVVIAALPRLTHLTFLALSTMPGMEEPPAALASTTSLRSFHWLLHMGNQDAVPAGPWLSGLERLEAPLQLLTNSLPALHSASRLHHLGVRCSAASSLQQLSPLLSWAASHPTLQRLVLAANPPLRAAAFSDVSAAQRRNPRLAIEEGDRLNLIFLSVDALFDLCFGPSF